MGVPRSTLHRWVDHYWRGGVEALHDRPWLPDRVWNRLPDEVRPRIVDLALEAPELSPHEIAVCFIDEHDYFVPEASVYHLLKAQVLITSPKFIVIKSADPFHTKTTAPNQLWQTDFTYFKATSWGWSYLSTVLDDFSRSIIAWKLRTTTATSDGTATVKLALQGSATNQATVRHRPRLLSDDGLSYVAGELAEWLDRQAIDHAHGAPNHPRTHGKIEL